MKKIFKTILAVFFASVFFASCDGIIFEDIRKEVKLEDAQISGDINAIIRYKDYIAVQNGAIWVKSAALQDRHGWIKIPKPSANADYSYVYMLAADSNNLYAMVSAINENTHDSENESDGTKLFCSSNLGSSWKLITIDETSTFTSGTTSLFCTNTESEENRKAFFRYNSKIYELDGETSTDKTSTYDLLPSSSVSTIKYSAFFGGNVYLSSYPVTTSSSYIYYAVGSHVYYTDDISEGWASYDMDCNTIYSVALTSDYILLGTSGGIYHAKLNDGKAENDVSSFSTNAASTLSSDYEVRCLLVMDSTKTELSSIIYGTSIYSGKNGNTSNCGLWGYFPAASSSSGKWNRE